MNFKTFITTAAITTISLVTLFQVASTIILNDNMKTVVATTSDTNDKVLESIRLLDLRIQENTNNIEDLTYMLTKMAERKEVK